MTLTIEQRLLLRRAGLLFGLAMLTGLWAGVVLSHGRAVGIDWDWRPKYERLVLSSHLNGLFGCFWMLGVAGTMSFVGLDEKQKHRLALLTTVASYGNWAVTLFASFLDERGLAFLGNARNDSIAGLLQVFVVIPTLAATYYWVRGLYRAT